MDSSYQRRGPDEDRAADRQGPAPTERRQETASAEFAPLERLASSVGNRAFGALVREGAGILPGGRAHPDVEAAIASTRGQGSSLDSGVRERFGPFLGSLDDVRVHTDAGADALARSVSARAFATGRDLYFSRGQYRPGSSSGDRLLAHELAHVVQQRSASTSGPLTVSQPGDPLEAEADAAAGELLG